MTFDKGDERFIFSTIGAQVESWKIGDRWVIFPAHTIGNGKRRGGIPVCAPFFGSPPKEMNDLKKHGWLRNSEIHPFTVKEVDNEGAIEVTFGPYMTTPSEQYPWALEYAIGYLFAEKSLTMFMNILRPLYDVAGVAPILPAFHPYISAGIVHIGKYFPKFSETAHSIEI